MTTLTDDFNRANAATLGANWYDIHGSGLSIQSNQATAGGDFSYDGSGYNTALTNNHYCQAVVNWSAGAGSKYVDFKVRNNGLTGASQDGYQGSIGLDGGDWYLSRIDNGTSTDLATGTTTTTTGSTFRVEIEGSTLRFLRNGVQFGTTTDSTYASGGYTGLGGYLPIALVSFDNFEAGDIGGAASGAPRYAGHLFKMMGG